MGLDVTFYLWQSQPVKKSVFFIAELLSSFSLVSIVSWWSLGHISWYYYLLIYRAIALLFGCLQN